MGFTGYLVVARAAAPLTTLEPLAGLTTALAGHRPDQWQLGVITRPDLDLPDLLAALVDTTASPVLVAAVVGSSYAEVFADSPGGRQWHAVLRAPDGTATAAERLEANAVAAAAWAAEAGLSTTADAVREALRAAEHAPPRRPPCPPVAPPTRSSTRSSSSYARSSRSSRSRCLS